MKNFKSKSLAVLLALVMMVGVFAPSMARAEGTAEATDVVIHKMLLEDLTDWPKPTNPDGTQQGIKDDKKYDGNQIANIEDYFGTGAKELAGVNFTYWKVTEEQYKVMMAEPGKYKTVAQVDGYLTETEKASKTVVGPTTETGLTIKELEKGWYWFVENPDANLEGGATISGYAAVPFGLQLPVYKADGTTFGTEENALHVYPKNTTSEKPDVTKKLDGIDGDHNTEDTAKDFTVGSEVPYIITTTIKTGTKYQTAKWSDQMTEGLTFGQDQLDAMQITIGGAPADTKDYEKKLVGNGFEVKLTPQGLEKINGKDANTVITIKYKAILNEKALVEIPESNDVTFNYGNNPDHGNTPVPTKPNPNGELTVKKTWADGIQLPVDGITVEFTLYDAQTGKKVEFDDGQDNPKEIKATTTDEISHTWTGLDKDKEYKVVETAIEGYSAEYGKVGDNGEISIKNWKDGNPPPITPEEPKVVTGGKRFQKIDPKKEAGKQGLAGAEFLVKNAEGKWLKAKDNAQLEADQKAYQKAEKDYQDAVKNSSLDKDAKKIARDAAYRTVKTTWEWKEYNDKDTAKANGAYVVTSGEDGYFKVTGLAYGDYKLVEVKAPEGYALLTEEIPFTVAKGSLENTEGIIQKVENKKITIPQTGGIGTILFTVIGAGLMGGAVFAMKKKDKEEEEDDEE